MKTTKIFSSHDASPIATEDAFIDGQIKTIFPLFDRDFFSTHDESDALHENLPRKHPVKKLFLETKDSIELTSGYDATVGDRQVSWEACKKNNSTGFSKIWRFKDLLGRWGPFVFLNERKVAGKKV